MVELNWSDPLPLSGRHVHAANSDMEGSPRPMRSLGLGRRLGSRRLLLGLGEGALPFAVPLRVGL